MREYIDVTGKTEDEAIANGLQQLGMDRDDVSVEILERAKSGFLGFGAAPAKIRMYFGPEEEETPAPVKKEAPVREKKPKEKPREKPEKQEKPEKAEKPEKKEPAAKRENPEKQEKKEQKKERKPWKQETSEQPAAVQFIPAETVELPHGDPVVELGAEVDDEKAQAIKSFLSGLLNQMGTPAGIKVYQPEKGRYKVILEGQGLGALIGRRGETLDAIQQLTGYAVNRTGGRVRVQLDAEGYREKREQSLQNLARKVAGKVVRYRRSVTLEAMNAYERHVIHTALQDYPGVTTYSTGTDPNRRVVVAFDRQSANN